MGRRSAPKKPTLVSPVLSGRSLEPDRKPSRWQFLGEHRVMVLAVAAALVILVALGVTKWVAESAADSVTGERAAEIRKILDGSTPREFLAFNAGVKTPGSLAEQIRNQDGFVNIKAVAESATIRFQPEGWWSGFTERCIVAVVEESKILVSVPKVACVRVELPGS